MPILKGAGGPVVGLDIGSNYIKVVEARLGKDLELNSVHVHLGCLCAHSASASSGASSVLATGAR